MADTRFKAEQGLYVPPTAANSEINQLTVNGALAVTGVTNFANAQLVAGSSNSTGNATLLFANVKIDTSNLHVTGLANFDRAVRFANDVIVSGFLSYNQVANGDIIPVSNNVYNLGNNTMRFLTLYTNQIIASGYITVTANAALGNTTVTGFANIQGTVLATGAATFRSTLLSNGAATIANTLAVGNTTVTGFANVSGTLTVNGAATIANTLAVGNTTVTGFANVSSTLTVNGATTIANTIATGNTTVTGFANVSGTLTVNGATTIANTLNVTANVTGVQYAAGANVLVTAAHILIGNSTVNTFANSSALNTGALTAANAASLSNTLGVAGLATLSGGMTTVTANAVTINTTTLNANTLNIQNVSTFTGNVSFVSKAIPGSNGISLGETTRRWDIWANNLTAATMDVSTLNVATVNVTSEVSMKTYRSTVNAVSVSTNTHTVNCAVASVHALTLGNNVTLSVGSIPATGLVNLTIFLIQDATGSRLINNTGLWSTIRWVDGTAPILTTTPNKTDVVTIMTYDGGTTWYGALNMFNM